MGRYSGPSIAHLTRWPHVTYHVPAFDAQGYGSPNEDRTAAPIHMSNVLSSEISDGANRGQHTLALDIDLPTVLIPSSTPGHFHLLIDHPMSWATYTEILEVLGRAGILEGGYVSASVGRGHTSIRLPWIRKRQRARTTTDEIEAPF